MPVSALPAMRAAIAYSAPTATAASGWWTSGGISASAVVAVWQPKGAASAADSYVNLANPGTYDLTFGSAPTFDTSYGWLGTSSSYADAGFYVQDGWSILVRFSDAPQDNTFKASCGSSQIRIRTSRNLAGDGGIMDTNITYGTFTNNVLDTGMASGVILVTPSFVYADGAQVLVNTGTISATDNLYILAQNNSGSAVNYYNGGKVQAFAIYNTDVAAAQSDLYTAVAAL